MARPVAESKPEGLRVNFDRRLKLEFHGSRITSDAGLIAMDLKAIWEMSVYLFATAG